MPQPDKPDTYLLLDDHQLVWTNDLAPIAIPLMHRGHFSATSHYQLTVHLLYIWSRGAPDWVIQIVNDDNNELLYAQTEGIDSYAGKVSTYSITVVVTTRNIRIQAVRQSDNEEDLMVLGGSFLKMEVF